MRPRCWMFSQCFLALVLSSTCLLGQSRSPQPRITQAVEDSKLTVLRGNTHPLALPQYDQGAAPADLPMNRMLLVLQRGPEQEAALKQLLDDQQDKASPNYHKWLTPDEFGLQFGPADQDIQTITAWLQLHGFQVAQVSKGRTVIEFSGTAAQVQEAFHTEIDKYVVNGEQHWANASDPQIPAALAPVVGGILSLHNFRAQPLVHNLGIVSRAKDTGAITPLAQPLFTAPSPGGFCGVQGSPCYGVGPYDFATIYNLTPLWNATPAINGAGQTIAIVGETDIDPLDVTNFRNFFGLPAPNLQIIHDGPAPGILQDGEETESDLDVEWSGAVAPGATIDFVVAQSTETTQGIHLAALHIIDNNLAPVMSESYGQCELFMGTAGNQFFNQLWQQAAAQGITVMIATGDSGSAVCDRQTAAAPFPATNGLQVSGYSSTPYNVAVGGTDFNDLTSFSTYWNPTNSSTTEASAKSYIPETTWNDSCTNGVFGSLLGFSTNPETNCNNPRLINFVVPSGGSGGKSVCITSNGSTLSSCISAYPKPSWQSALTPHDSRRDVPDISLFAAGGSPSGSFYLICELDQSGGACNPNASTADFLGVGGTSASAPAFAGIMALVNQQTGARQGNANYVLYKLATQQPSAFHDVTSGTIAMPCATGSPNCTTSTPGLQYGVLSGYAATTGYDLATGLGSVDAFNLVTKWNSVTLAPSVTTLSSLTPTTITHGQPVSVTVGVAPQSGTGAPAGTVALVGGPTGSVTDFDSHTLDANGNAVWTTSLLPGGTYNVTAHYPGDGNYAGSNSTNSVPVTVNKETPNINIGLVTFDANGRVTSTGGTSAVYGSPYILRVGVTGTTCSSNTLGQEGCPTGSVNLTDNGSPVDAGTFLLNELGYTEDLVVQLPGGSNAVQVSYSGDSSFNAMAPTTTISITPSSTTMTAPIAANTVVDVPSSISTTVQSHSSGVSPTGTVAFFANGSPLPGNIRYIPNGAFLEASLPVSFPPGDYAITATYSGDQNYMPSSSPVANLQFRYPAPSTSISVNPSSVVAGNPVTVTATLDAHETGPALSGTVSFLGTLGAIPGAVAYSQGTDQNGFPTLQATFTFAPIFPEGIQAQYSGDSNYFSSSSGTISVSVSQPDFVLAVNPTVEVVSRGTTAQTTLTITGVGGVNELLNFDRASCTGLPAESVCSFSPNSVAGNGSTQVIISTTAPHGLAKRLSGKAHLPEWQTGLAIGLAGIFIIGGSARKRGRTALLSLFLLVAVLTLPSCGGGGSGGGGGPTDPGTPTGNYTVNVTATNGTFTHTVPFQLDVQ